MSAQFWIGFGIGGVVGWPLILAVIGLGARVRHGAWTTVRGENCSCPKESRTRGSVPDDQWSPLFRCPICGARWVRVWLARVPGAGRVLVRWWPERRITDEDELERRLARAYGGAS